MQKNYFSIFAWISYSIFNKISLATDNLSWHLSKWQFNYFRYSLVIEHRIRISYFQVLNTRGQLKLLGLYPWIPPGSSNHQAPDSAQQTPALLGARVTLAKRRPAYTIFFNFFKNAIFPKFLGNTLNIYSKLLVMRLNKFEIVSQ